MACNTTTALLLLKSLPLLRLSSSRSAAAVSLSSAIAAAARHLSSGAPPPLNSPENPIKSAEVGAEEKEFRRWKEREKEILRDVQPVVLFVKEILHSNRYRDGQKLNEEDEKLIVENLLAYHPRSKDKIGCGLDAILVDKHPQFTKTRCLFVMRTDGGWIDFSYQKCLLAYIRKKYPSHADRFIKEHFKRSLK